MTRLPAPRRPADRGASTLELTAAVTVLGGVSALAIVTLTPLTSDAVSVACRAQIENVRMAAAAYETQHAAGVYPPDQATLVAGGYLATVLPDVSYRRTAGSFEVKGAGTCRT